MLTLSLHFFVNAIFLAPFFQDLHQPIPEISDSNCQVVNANASCFPNGPITHSRQENLSTERNLTGQWQLKWNDTIDSSVSEYPHSCSLNIKEMDKVISGNFVGLVAGTQRDAIITGKLEGEGATRILIFQQRENGYICSYQAIDNGGAITGVWHDTENRLGTFQLLKYQ